MNAGEEWDAITADPEFRAQPSTEQNRVALSFFNKRIAPNVPPDQHEATRHEFFADAFRAPEVEAQPAPSLGAAVKGLALHGPAGAAIGARFGDKGLGLARQAVKDTLHDPVPGLAPVADALRTGIPGAIAEAGGRAGLPTAGAALGTAVGTLGELVPKTGGELAMAGLGGPALEAAGAAGARVAPTVVSKLSGASLPEATRAIGRAKELMNPELLKPETIDKATAGIGEAMKGARSALGRRLGLAEDAAIAKAPDRVLAVGSIGDELAQKFQRAGFSADGVRVGDHANPLDPRLQSIIDRFRNIQAATPASPILDRFGVPLPGKPPVPRDMALRDALQLKKDIYGLVSFDPKVKAVMGVGPAEEAFLKDAAMNLDEHIRTGAAADPALNSATDKFARAAKGYGKLAKTALSGQIDTVSKRLGRIFNAGDITRKVGSPLADEIGAGSKQLETLLDAKTAQRFAPWVNPKVSGSFENTGGGALGNILKIAGAGAGASVAPGTIPQKLATGAAILAGTSPRLINAGIRAAVVPVGESAVVDAAASPAARAVMASPLMRRLRKKEK